MTTLECQNCGTLTQAIAGALARPACPECNERTWRTASGATVAPFEIGSESYFAANPHGQEIDRYSAPVLAPVRACTACGGSDGRTRLGGLQCLDCYVP